MTVMGTPFRIGTTSFIYPDHVLPNVRRLAHQVDDIEILFFDLRNPADLPAADELEELREIKSRESLSFTIHTPLAASLASQNRERTQESVQEVCRAIQLATELEPFGYVIHVYLGEHEGDEPPADVNAWRKRAEDSLLAIIDLGTPANQLCVESLDYDFALIEPVIDELGLSVALDIGHLHRDGLPIEDVLHRNLHRTRIIQWHGVDPKDRDHRSLKHYPDGQAAWLLDTSIRERFSGVLTIEVFREADFKESLQIVKALVQERV